jgi:hypothetical protein
LRWSGLKRCTAILSAIEGAFLGALFAPTPAFALQSLARRSCWMVAWACTNESRSERLRRWPHWKCTAILSAEDQLRWWECWTTNVKFWTFEGTFRSKCCRLLSTTSMAKSVSLCSAATDECELPVENVQYFVAGTAIGGTARRPLWWTQRRASHPPIVHCNL